jgi:hypothetical protein
MTFLDKQGEMDCARQYGYYGKSGSGGVGRAPWNFSQEGESERFVAIILAVPKLGNLPILHAAEALSGAESLSKKGTGRCKEAPSMRWLPLVWLPTLAFTGCLSTALERHTRQQIETAADLRYKEVLSNLAMFDVNPWSLPAYTTIYAGTSKLSDMGTIGSTPVIGRELISGKSVTHFQGETLDIPVQRQIIQTWSLDPVTSPEKLQAIRACCWWVLFGPENIGKEDRQLLSKWQEGAHMQPGHYFAVEEDLTKIAPGWLHRGCLKDVPAHAAYKAHYHGRWVWVNADGVESLSKFCLVLQTISRAKTAEAYFPQPETRKITFTDTSHGGMKIQVTAYVDRQGRLVAGDGKYAEPVKNRLENVPSDANLRSQIGAAAATK